MSDSFHQTVILIDSVFILYQDGVGLKSVKSLFECRIVSLYSYL